MQSEIPKGHLNLLNECDPRNCCDAESEQVQGWTAHIIFRAAPLALYGPTFRGQPTGPRSPSRSREQVWPIISLYFILNAFLPEKIASF